MKWSIIIIASKICCHFEETQNEITPMETQSKLRKDANDELVDATFYIKHF